MVEFFRQAQYGALFLVVAGAFGYVTVTCVGAWQSALSPRTPQGGQEAVQTVFYARFVTYGMVVSGLGWWVIQG